jgi:hypothetical protein
MSSSLYTVSLSVNDPTALQKPTHIVMWQDSSTDTLANLTERLASLEKAVASLTGSASSSLEASPAKPASCDDVVKRSPLISGISMERSADCSGNLCAVVDTLDAAALMKEVIEKPFVLEATGLPEASPSASASASASAALEHELEEVDADTDICSGDDDQEVDDEEEEDLVDEEEEEAVEYEEIEFKGVTYYKDYENQVYVLDADGDLDDTPVGVWNEEKKKVLKYAKA